MTHSMIRITIKNSSFLKKQSKKEKKLISDIKRLTFFIFYYKMKVL